MPSSNIKQEFYTRDGKLLDELETYYSHVLDNANLNFANPITANMCYFNNSGKIFADGPKLGRTLVFITKPNLNFAAYDNITKCRVFNYLTSSKMGNTLARMLMFPRCAYNINYGGYEEFAFGKLGLLKGPVGNGVIGGKPYKDGTPTDRMREYGSDSIEGLGMSFKLSPTCFNTLLSNCCVETSNGKDIVLETKETEGDYSGNRLQYAAGLDETTGPGELTLTFDDLYGSPCLNQIIMWLYAMHYATKGIYVPYKSYVVNRIIDYTCSIYVFMLDTDQRTIVRWTAYRGCFPRSAPFGQIMHTREINMQALQQISIPFAYNMACPMDPLVLNEFNMIAEPALLKSYRENVIDDNDKYSSDIFFRGKNHFLTLEEAEYFKYAFRPKRDFAPDKVLLDRSTNWSSGGTGQLKKYIERADGVLNDEDTEEYNRMYPSGYNRFHGMNHADSFLHPYIVEGNKLMFL